MNILIASIGKPAKNDPTTALCEEYQKRLPWDVTIKILSSKKNLPSAKQKEEEAGILLAAVPKGAVVIVLDERGKTPTSAEFAKQISNWQGRGQTSLAFLIGGAEGHGEAVLTRADYKLSLGAMTWPHKFVRAMLTEQLYRAYTILEGHPYHKE